MTHDKNTNRRRIYDPPFTALAAAYIRSIFCSLGLLFGTVPVDADVLVFRCGCSLTWEKVAARCLSLSAFFKNGLGRFSSSCRSHCVGEVGEMATCEDLVLVKVPIAETEILEDEAVGCSELER